MSRSVPPRSVPEGLRAVLRARIAACLAPARPDDLRADSEAVRARLRDARLRLDRLAARAHVGPPHPDMTMHALLTAWPEARAVLARRGLPACDACAVGAEETLAEAAALEGFDLPGVLTDIRSLS
ncbi:MAG: hypothetical protein RLZZ299_1241 [Pseudomonadota bacterium]|jgi:hypothetical protein